MSFTHEKLHVYAVSLDFVALADDLVRELPPRRAYLADQLHRAATSVPLNLAEGASEYSPREKARFYRMAKRSGAECSALIDVLRRLRITDEEAARTAQKLIGEVVAMTTTMIRSLD